MTELSNYSAPKSNVNKTFTSEELSEPTIFGFKGRIGRVRYFSYSSVGFIAFYFSMLIPTVLMSFHIAVAAIGFVICGLAFIAITFGWTIKRLHDLSLSGWLALLNFIPIINFFFFLYLIFSPGKERENQYGLPPKLNSTGVIVGASLGGAFAAMMIIGILAAIALPAYADYIEKAKEASALQSERQESFDTNK
ncbi:MAG: DUF805 domain-containing protein [Saccharospirillaceae bacterium]|nr:DUF805 domain-containing protein [Pseudomonadales bacterium]NRB78567.1 DUF805 domain-containing protein [Saccharospirillaceae bacterium]